MTGNRFCVAGGWECPRDAEHGYHEVRELVGTTPCLDDLLDTHDFVRPRRQHGRLVLTVRPADGGRYIAFEQPDATRCCADH